MKKTFVMAITLNDRLETAHAVQELLTENGKMVNLRCGTHESGEEQGTIILKLKGARDRVAALDASFNALDGVKCKYMEL